MVALTRVCTDRLLFSGGLVGNLMTAFFADSRVVGFDGFSSIPGGQSPSVSP